MAVPAERPEITRDNIVTWVEMYIRDGVQPNEAFDQVFDDLRRMGRLTDLAELIGSDLIGGIWRKRNQAQRRPTDPPEFRTVQDSPAVRGNTSEWVPDRVVPIPIEKAKTYLDAQEKVNGEWVRVGDMTKQQCEALAKGYGRMAQPLLHNKAYFLAVSVTLQDGETVKDRFDEEKLTRLYKRTQVA